MKVDVPVDEFRKELNRLINYNQFEIKLDFERMMEFFGGPLIPFAGSIAGNSFNLRRNVFWSMRSSWYIRGAYEEKNGVTEVQYHMVRDQFLFYLFRISAVLPGLLFLTGSFASMSFGLIIFGSSLPFATLLFVHFVDEYRARKLVNTFLTELTMMPHNHKSRFKK